MTKSRIKLLRPLPSRARRRLAHALPGSPHARGPARKRDAVPSGTPAAVPATAEIALPAGSDAPGQPYEWLTAFDELGEPVFIHDREFRILRCNPAYAALAGQPMEALLGKPYWQVFPKLDGPLGNCVEALLKGASEVKSELTAAAGHVFLSHDITAHRPSGEFWYSRHVMENMTARRIDEDAWKLKAALADAVVASMPGALMVMDRQKRLVRWNGGLAALTGRPEDALAGVDVLSLVSDLERERIAAKLDEAFVSGHAEGELHLLDGRGGMEHCIFSARALEASGTRHVACVAFGRSAVRQLGGDLATEKALSDTIIESAPGPYYVVDQNAKLLRWNRRLRELVGLEDRQLLGSSVLATIHEQDRPLASAKFLAALAMGYAEMEVRIPTATHGTRVFLKTARRFEIDGAPYITGFCIDITERKEAETALIQQKAFYDALVNSVPGAFYVVDREGNYVTWNSYLNRLTGLGDEELRKRSSLLTIAEDDRPLAAAAMKQAFESGYGQAELHVLTRDRGIRLYFMTARRFRVGDAEFLVGVGVDTTDRGARIRELEQRASTDPLTRVPNRSHFLSLAAEEFARSRRYGHPLSLWMIDIDHFKAVNDTYGHHAGDVALQALGDISRQALRDWDVMGRMGGEEFAVLLPDTDTSQALLVAERLRQTIATTKVPVEPGTMTHLTISIGVATIRDDDGDVERLIDRADQALLEAKHTGRDKVCVAESGVRL
jgi:diguanylate cyclase (GGDEF)-like protein/PAS domain S-box-containing protein